MRNFIIVLSLILLVVISCGKPQRGEPGLGGDRGPAGETGEKGDQGEPGVGPVIEVIVPCPQLVAQYPEVLWRMDGKIYGVYASGQKVHLVELSPGNYHTTDGRNCNFTVTADLQVL